MQGELISQHRQAREAERHQRERGAPAQDAFKAHCPPRRGRRQQRERQRHDPDGRLGGEVIDRAWAVLTVAGVSPAGQRVSVARRGEAGWLVRGYRRSHHSRLYSAMWMNRG